MNGKMRSVVVSSVRAFTPWKLRFKQSSLNHPDRVLRRMESTTSSINRFSVVLYFPLAFRLISGYTDDPQATLL